MHQSLRIMNGILLCVGISLLFQRKGRWSKLVHTWQVTNVIYSCIAVSAMSIYIVKHFAEISLSTFTEAMGLCLTFWMVFVKLLIIMIRRKDLYELTNKLILSEYALNIGIISDIENHGMGNMVTELKKMIAESKSKFLGFVGILVKVWAVNAYLDLAFFTAFPLIMEFLYPGNYTREMPFGMSFPWDPKKTPFYQFSYFLQFWAGFICIATYVGPDTYFALLVGHIIRQLKIVGYVMSHLDELSSEVSELEGQQLTRDDANARVIARCAKQYVQLKGFCEKVNSMYAPFFFVQILCTSAMMCLCMFTIATDQNKMSASGLKNIMYSCGIILQIGVYCAVVQQLVIQSERLQYCVVERWWVQARRNRSSLLVFQAALQRPITMNVFGSVELCHATFGTVMRTAFSYFTFLQTVTE